MALCADDTEERVIVLSGKIYINYICNMSDLEKGASASALAELSLNTTSADSKS